MRVRARVRVRVGQVALQHTDVARVHLVRVRLTVRVRARLGGS